VDLIILRRLALGSRVQGPSARQISIAGEVVPQAGIVPYHNAAETLQTGRSQFVYLASVMEKGQVTEVSRTLGERERTLLRSEGRVA
jgi:hypothetical protein